METKRGRDLFEAWAIIKACLEADAPMSEDVKAYLLEVARAIDDLNEGVRRGDATPEAAADAVPARLELTAGMYRRWLRARRDFIAGNVLEHQAAHTSRQSKDITADLGQQLNMSPRQVYRARAKLRRKVD